MPIYHQLGRIPHKRHTTFKKEDGSLHHEHLMSAYGFTGPTSLLYHLRIPTSLTEEKLLRELDWSGDPDPTMRLRHFRLFNIPNAKSAVLDRTPIAYNNKVAVSYVAPTEEDDFFYRNGMGDEIIYVFEGEGVLETSFGELPFRAGDHIVIHRTIPHRWRLGKGPHRFLVVESRDYLRWPERYRTEFGQLNEQSPYCERDIRRPQKLVTIDEEGEFRIITKRGNVLTEAIQDHHPFDVVGWDGYYYPWAFNIEDFEPITGRIHQPPPVHQTFEADGFVMCAFVPRMFDYHPEAIPAPYNHSNVMSDEFLFYANDEFMSRKGIEMGSVTLHPYGQPHGPQPGKYEGSVGAKQTKELAVMLDTFDPMTVAKAVKDVEDEEYARSWLK